MKEMLLHDSIIDNDATKEEKTIVYNEDKSETYYLEDLDANKGKLETRYETVHHEAVEAIEEISHYEVVAEYPNGGKDVEKVIDRPGQAGREAYDEEVEYQVWIPYTEVDIQVKALDEEMEQLKQWLSDTDYKAIKYAEGWITFEEYIPMRDDRQNWRFRIGQIEREKAILLGLPYEEEAPVVDLHANDMPENMEIPEEEENVVETEA